VHRVVIARNNNSKTPDGSSKTEEQSGLFNLLGIVLALCLRYCCWWEFDFRTGTLFCRQW